MGENHCGGFEGFYSSGNVHGNEKKPNYKTYWMKNFLFQCNMVSSIMSQAPFIDLRRCLHLTNSRGERYVEREALGFHKLHQTRWVLNGIRDLCKTTWNLRKICTIDEMMNQYKGIYCPI